MLPTTAKLSSLVADRSGAKVFVSSVEPVVDCHLKKDSID